MEALAPTLTNLPGPIAAAGAVVLVLGACCRVLPVADIYDALTARDRPYKRALPPSRALEILGYEVKDGHIDAELVRNRHGPVGRWIMEWKCDECQFSEPSAYPQPVAATPAHRPHQAQARAGHRLAS